MQNSKSVNVEEASDFIASIEVNRPEALNALNVDVLQGVLLALEQLKGRDNLRALVIKGSGEKAFVAGADIHGMADLGPRAIADYVELGQRVMRSIEMFPMPVIAAVNGYALGGGYELALACDLILASESAKVGQPEVNLGIIPGFGGTQRLIQRCGIGTTRRLVYSGDIIGADEALRLGLVDQVFTAEEFDQKVQKFVENIAAKAPLAVQGAKRVIREYEESEMLSGLRREVEMFLKLFETADREEGMRAFMQKRAAEFCGK